MKRKKSDFSTTSFDKLKPSRVSGTNCPPDSQFLRTSHKRTWLGVFEHIVSFSLRAGHKGASSTLQYGLVSRTAVALICPQFFFHFLARTSPPLRTKPSKTIYSVCNE